MAEKKHDDLADALAGMMNTPAEAETDGHDSMEHEEGHQAGPSASPQPAAAAPTPPPRKVPPAPAPPPVKPRPPVPSTATSRAPGPAAPAVAASKPRPQTPTSPIRAATPVAARARAEGPPTAASARPAAPGNSAQVDASFSAQDANWMGQAPADDDAMIAPAAPVETLAHVPHRVHVKVSVAAALDFKRTLIPVYLTTAACTGVAGGLHWIMPDSFFADMPLWFSILMFCFALPMLFFTVFTMMQVHHQLAARK